MNAVLRSWRDLATWAKIFVSTIVMLAGAVVSVPPAWTALGLPEVATRAHVSGVITPIKQAQDQTTTEVRDLKIGQIKKDTADLYRERFQWNTKIKELPGGSAARFDYEWRIEQINQEIRENEERLAIVQRRDLRPNQ